MRAGREESGYLKRFYENEAHLRIHSKKKHFHRKNNKSLHMNQWLNNNQLKTNKMTFFVSLATC